MISGRYNIVLEEGSLWWRKLWWFHANRNIRDLTFWTFRMKIRAKYSDVSAAFSMVEDGNRIQNFLDKGYIIVKIDADESAVFTFDNAVFDLEAVPVSITDIQISGAYTSANVDVSAGTITAAGGTPYSAINAGDIIRIRNSLGGYDGSLEVSTATSTVITATNALGGADNATDTQLVVQHLVEDEEKAHRLIGGRVIFRKEATY